MTIYDPIIFLRLHGWGVVSSEDTQVIDCASTNNSTGVASLYITSIATINADEIGSEVFISGVTGLVDGFYTLTNYTVGGPSPGLDTIEIKGDPDLFSLVPGGGIYIGSAIRIEDHYKICNRIPDFVTGTSAQSRWYLNLIDITPTLSSQVNVRGGVSKIDGVTITHNFIFEELDRIRFKVLNEDDSIRTSGFIYFNPAQTSNIEVENGIPYLGSYANPNTPPALGLYEPTWWGSECIRTDSSSGSGPYTLSMTRGLLRTELSVHPYGQLFFQGMTTPVGKVADVFIGLRNLESYYDFSLISNGPITNMDYGSGVIEQTLEISSDLLKAIRKKPAETYTKVNFLEEVSQIEFFSPYGSNWQWVKIGKAAFRVESFYIVNTEEGTNRTNGQDGFVIRRSTILNERIVNDGGIGLLNGVMIERASDANEFAKINYPAIYPTSQANNRYPGNDEESRQSREDLIESILSNNYLVYNQPSLYFQPTYQIDRMVKDNSELEMVHVFEPQHFGPDNNFVFDPASLFNTMAIGCNPIDLLLQILLTKGGTGTNTFVFEGTTFNFDVLPVEIGLGYSPNQIDLASFLRTAELFKNNNVYFSNAFIAAEDAEDMLAWIDKNVLKPYLLSISTDSRGKIQLTELCDSARRPDMAVLTDSDLFQLAGEVPVTFTRDSSALVSRITYSFTRPYLTPDNSFSKDTVNYRYAFDGIADHYRSLGSADVSSKPKFAPFFSVNEAQAFGDYLGRYLGNYRSPFPVVECFVDQDFGSNTFTVGKYQILNLSRLPNANGNLDSNLFGICLVVKRQKDILNGVDKLTLAVVETINTNNLIRFAPSAEVDSGSTGTVIKLVDSIFIPTFLSDYDSDAESFKVGDSVLLYDENFVLRSTANAPLIDAINNATEFEIDTDFEDGGGPIVPAASDIIVLSKKSDQSIDFTLNNYAYVFTSRADASNWEIN
jgi:hypothetical protein